jgi:hypothetical protein
MFKAKRGEVWLVDLGPGGEGPAELHATSARGFAHANSPQPAT